MKGQNLMVLPRIVHLYAGHILPFLAIFNSKDVSAYPTIFNSDKEIFPGLCDCFICSSGLLLELFLKQFLSFFLWVIFSSLVSCDLCLTFYYVRMRKWTNNEDNLSPGQACAVTTYSWFNQTLVSAMSSSACKQDLIRGPQWKELGVWNPSVRYT